MVRIIFMHLRYHLIRVHLTRIKQASSLTATLRALIIILETSRILRRYDTSFATMHLELIWQCNGYSS